MNTCRYCSCSFDPAAWQIAKSDYACKPCAHIKRAEWRARRKAEGQPVVSTRMPREYHRAYEAEYFEKEENRLRRNAWMRAYRVAHATKDAARLRVRRAIEAGVLVRQPCEACGAARVHAHHDDYCKPLDVRWLCPEHHREHHREHHAKATGVEA